MQPLKKKKSKQTGEIEHGNSRLCLKRGTILTHNTNEKEISK